MYPYPQYRSSLQLEWSNWFNCTQDEVQRYAPLNAGIYILAYKCNEQWYVFYVGQTDNLDRRLKEHLADNEPNICIRNKVKNHICMFRYAKVSTQSDRDKAERALYKKYSPSCNDSNAIPNVGDIEINI